MRRSIILASAAKRAARRLLVAALAAVSFQGCDFADAPPRGGSRDFAREVDDLHERNRSLHERSLKLDQRLKNLSSDVEQLRAALAPLSAEWAYDASRELEVRLGRARERMATLTAATGFDGKAMADAAEESIDELEAIRDRVRADLAQRAEPASPGAAPRQ